MQTSCTKAEFETCIQPTTPCHIAWIPPKFSTCNCLQSLGMVSAASHLEGLALVVKDNEDSSWLVKLGEAVAYMGCCNCDNLLGKADTGNLTLYNRGKALGQNRRDKPFMSESWSRPICEWLDVPCANLKVLWGPLKCGHSSHTWEKQRKQVLN